MGLTSHAEFKRGRLAAELCASTQGRTATTLLARLDEHCQQYENGQALSSEYQNGPFGVFEGRSNCLKGTETGHPVDAAPNSQIDGNVAHPAPDLELGANPMTDFFADESLATHDPASNGSSVEQIEPVRHNDWIDHNTALDAEMAYTLPHGAPWELGDPFSSTGDFDMLLDMSNQDWGTMCLLDDIARPAGSTADLGSSGSPSREAIPSAQQRQIDGLDRSRLLNEAPALLRCYQTGKKGSTPIKHSFWNSFVLPSAMRTFAELSVFGEASDASLAMFYSALANGAHMMRRSEQEHSSMSRWQLTAESAQEAAHSSLQSAIQSSPGQSVKQELLVANLALSIISVSQQ